VITNKLTKIIKKKNRMTSQKSTRKKDSEKNTFICFCSPSLDAIIASSSDLFLSRELGVLLELQRKFKTLLTSVSILGLLSNLLETKLLTVLTIPSMT
jgi:hypothetical protein